MVLSRVSLLQHKHECRANIKQTGKHWYFRHQTAYKPVVKKSQSNKQLHSQLICKILNICEFEATNKHMCTYLGQL